VAASYRRKGRGEKKICPRSKREKNAPDHKKKIQSVTGQGKKGNQREKNEFRKGGKGKKKKGERLAPAEAKGKKKKKVPALINCFKKGGGKRGGSTIQPISEKEKGTACPDYVLGEKKKGRKTPN